MVTETIFSGNAVVIPMDEVSHIEKDRRPGYEDGIRIVFKYSKWNSLGYFEPTVCLRWEEAKGFLSCWCHYRGELELQSTSSIYALNTLLRIEGMKAENQKRAFLGQGVAYDEEAFVALIQETRA